ncbi:gamma-glutamyl:cysteine ligase YbdK (ATP-grasp superfamily) [Mucilaginibacter sp. OAE612]
MLVDETIAFTALFQALCAKLYKLRAQNMKFINYSRALINENKWRAARYGIDGKMIDFGKEMEVNTRSLILELLDFVDDVVDELGSRDDLQYVHNILEHGTGADRQLAIYQQNNNFADVVDYITSQTLKGL